MGRLLTILCADIIVENRSALDAFLLLFRSQTEAHRGRPVKTADGAPVAVFEQPAHALLTALALRHAIEDAALSDVVQPARFAVASGEVDESAEEVTGQAVTTALRLKDVTPAGRIWLAGDAPAGLRPGEIQSTRVGVMSLKGMTQPVKVVEACPRQPLPWRFRVPIALFVVLALVIAGLVSLLLCCLSIDSHRHDRVPKRERTILHPQS